MAPDPLKPLKQTARKVAAAEARLDALRITRNAQIKEAAAKGRGSEREIAAAAGVTKGYVYRIRQGKAPVK